MKTYSSKGFTLVELLVVMLMLVVLTTVAIPNLSGFADRQHLSGAAEQVYGHLQQARLAAISRSAPVFVSYTSDGTNDWSYGMSMNANCDPEIADPTDASACVMVIDDGDGNVDPGDGSVDAADLVLTRFLDDDFEDISMTLANFSNGTQISFDGVRGTSDSGDILLVSAQGNQLTIQVGLLGDGRICSPDSSVGGYSNANC